MMTFINLTEPNTYRNSIPRNSPNFQHGVLQVPQECQEEMAWMEGPEWMVLWGTLAGTDPQEKMVILGLAELPGPQG